MGPAISAECLTWPVAGRQTGALRIASDQAVPTVWNMQASMASWGLRPPRTR
jgi:hypothetical protein